MNNEASESLMAPRCVCEGSYQNPLAITYLFLIKKNIHLCSFFVVHLDRIDRRTDSPADGRTDGRFVVIWFSFYVFVFLACGTVGFSHTAFFGIGLAVQRLTNSNHSGEETAPARPP